MRNLAISIFMLTAFYYFISAVLAFGSQMEQAKEGMVCHLHSPSCKEIK